MATTTTTTTTTTTVRAQVLALGGSMAAGVDCIDRPAAVGGNSGGGGGGGGSENPLFAGKACSYSARFARDLEATYQGGGGGGGGPVGVTYRNLAMGGTTTAGALPQLPLLLAGGDGPAGRATGRQAGPDLVLVDFSVNDRFEEQDWVEAAVSRAGSSSDSSTGGGGGDGAAGFDAGAKVFAATEALLRHVLAAHPNTAIVRARDHTDPHASCFYFFYYICLRSPSFPRRNGCEGRVEQAVAAGEAPRERAPPEAEAPGDGSVRWGPRMGRIAAAVLAAWGAPPTSG